MKDILIALLLSLSPVSELRGGIPYALAKGISLPLTIFSCIIANILIIFFIFFFLDFLHERFLKLRAYKKLSSFILKKMRKRSKKVEKNISLYGFPALAIFVCIPLPITGAWTGSIIAWLLNLERKKSIMAIACGVIIAGIIVTLAWLGVITMIGL